MVNSWASFIWTGVGNCLPCFTSSGEDISTPTLESIKKSIDDADSIAQIDLLINFIESKLTETKSPTQGASTSASTSSSVDRVENSASNIRLTADVIEWIGSEADKLQNSELVNLSVTVMRAVGESHFLFLGLSLAAYALEKYVGIDRDESKCRELLENVVEVAKDVNKFRDAVPGEKEKVSKAVTVMVEGAFMCCDYIQRGSVSRYWHGVEAQLQTMKETMNEIRSSLTVSGVNYLARQTTRLLDPSSKNLLDFEPVGISEETLSDLKQLLDIEGRDPVRVLVLYGFGVIGKSTLAASLIQHLNLSSTAFKFCRVVIHEKPSDKTSHIIQLQRQIISDFGGNKWDIHNPVEGRKEVRNIMENKWCFLYIDNVADIDYVRQLLSLEEKTGEQKQKLRLVITSRQGHLERVLQINSKYYKEYRVRILSSEAAKELLRRTITAHERELHKHFDEEGLMNEVAEACRGVPILLTRFGIHLRYYARDQSSYEDVLEALRKGNFGRYSDGDEEQLGEMLLFVYNKLKDRDSEAQEAFLDICTYFHGWKWDLVAHIVGEGTLDILEGRMLVNRTEKRVFSINIRRDEDKVVVTVHDILCLMGRKEAQAQGTRITNYEEWNDTLQDQSKLKMVKGISLNERNIKGTPLECTILNGMHRSLRVLILGDGLSLVGPPCKAAFKNLRVYLQLRDITIFPFQDAFQLEKLAVFVNRSKPGMDLPLLPPSLKYICHSLAELQDCNSFATLQLQNLRTLEHFAIEKSTAVSANCFFERPGSPEMSADVPLSRPPDLDLILSKLEQDTMSLSTLLKLRGLDSSVYMMRLPGRLDLPASLRTLDLSVCQPVPERLSHLTALESLCLDSCVFEVLPQGFRHLAKLEHLSLENCDDLQMLPPDIGVLTALKSLNLSGCRNLRELPENMGRLFSLKTLNLNDCISLKKLPTRLGMLTSLHQLELKSCQNLKALPQNMKGLVSLKTLFLHGCTSLEKLSLDFGKLTSLKCLYLECKSLTSLPPELGQLSSLKSLSLKGCASEELPFNFKMMTSLNRLELEECQHLRAIPEDMGVLSSLKTLKLKYCASLEKLPDCIGMLTSLNWLEVEECRNLRALPQELGGLCSLETLKLKGCTSLEQLAHSLGMLTSLQHLHIILCDNLRELPEEFKSLSYDWYISECRNLQHLPQYFETESLSLFSMDSLEELPQSIGDVQLKRLSFFALSDCAKVCALPSNFGQLSFLEEITMYGCPSLKELPRGFESLPVLRYLSLTDCSSLVNLPTGFENSVSLRRVEINRCAILEGSAMERLVKLQNCFFLGIAGSTGLIRQWKEMQREAECLMFVDVEYSDEDNIGSRVRRLRQQNLM